MLELSRPITAAPTILEHLRNGGATDLRATTHPVWIVGRAPSGVLIELYWWPLHGYYLGRRSPEGGPTQRVGVFPSWTAAIDHALRV